MTREALIEKVRSLYQDEKFRLDAYFFCGFPSGMPNEKLMRACEEYLNALDAKQDVGDTAKKLVSELEAAASAKPKISGVNNMIETQDSVREILDHRALLC